MKKIIKKVVFAKKCKPNKYRLVKCGEDTATYAELQKNILLNEIESSQPKTKRNKKADVNLDNDIVKQKFEESVVYESKKKKRKSIFTNLILLAINIALVVFIASALVKNAEDASLSALVNAQGSRLNFLWYALLFFIIYMLLDATIVSLLVKKTTGKFRPWLSFKSCANSRYYEAVTPLAVGGQPAQIVSLAKGGVSPGIATTIPLIKTTLINFVVVLIALANFVFVGPTIRFDNGFIDILCSLLKILAYIGIIINILYLTFMIIVANSKVIGRSLARGVIKVGYKLKIVKNYRESYNKIMRQVFEFQNSMEYLKKNFGFMVGSVLILIFQQLAFASVPFVVSIALSNIEFVNFGAVLLFWLQCVAKYYICYMAASFIPLPGGTGMNEIAFVILFVPIIGSNFIVWGFLAWRLFTYYATILQGICFVIADTIAAGVKKDKINYHKPNLADQK